MSPLSWVLSFGPRSLLCRWTWSTSGSCLLRSVGPQAGPWIGAAFETCFYVTFCFLYCCLRGWHESLLSVFAAHFKFGRFDFCAFMFVYLTHFCCSGHGIRLQCSIHSCLHGWFMNNSRPYLLSSCATSPTCPTVLEHHSRHRFECKKWKGYRGRSGWHLEALNFAVLLRWSGFQHFGGLLQL